LNAFEDIAQEDGDNTALLILTRFVEQFPEHRGEAERLFEEVTKYSTLFGPVNEALAKSLGEK
jgi:hypothetical protein